MVRQKIRINVRWVMLCSEDIEIDWRLPPGVSVSRRKKDLHGSRLTLYHLRRSDAGDYICVGVNSYDRTEFKFQLVMYGTSSPTVMWLRGWLRGTNFPCPALDLQLMGDHLCWETVRCRSANLADLAFHPFGADK